MLHRKPYSPRIIHACIHRGIYNLEHENTFGEPQQSSYIYTGHNSCWVCQAIFVHNHVVTASLCLILSPYRYIAEDIYRFT